MAFTYNFADENSAKSSSSKKVLACYKLNMNIYVFIFKLLLSYSLRFICYVEGYCNL